MGRDKEKLGELLYKLERASSKEIGGKKTDFLAPMEESTYKEVDRKFKRMLMKVHPDRIPESFSEEDKALCNEISQSINTIRELMENYKKENKIKDDDAFTYPKEALEEYKQKRKERAQARAKAQTQKQSSRSTAQSETSKEKKTSNTNTNTRTQSSTRTRRKGEIYFSRGSIRKKLEEDKSQTYRKMKDGTVLYGYIYTDDTDGQEYEIYSENTYEELGNPDSKYEVDRKILSLYNLGRSKSYDVQNQYSQYGYVGKVSLENKTIQLGRNGKTFTREYKEPVYTLNKDIINELREENLKKTQTLSFESGTLTRKLDSNKKQSCYTAENGTVIYGYTFRRNDGQVQEIYSENTFEELANPSSQYEIERHLLSSYNLDKAKSYDVQNRNSQYGYIGKVSLKERRTASENIYDSVFVLDKDVKESLRRETLRKTKVLSFNNGTLEKKLRRGSNEQMYYIAKDGTMIYGYTLRDRNGQTQDIYTENTFEELADPINKDEIDRKMLSSYNLSKANSYNLKERASQFGYVGKVAIDETTRFPISRHVMNYNNLAYFRERVETAPRMASAKDKSGRQETITLEDGKKLYGYIISKGNGDKTLSKKVFFENSSSELLENMKKLVSKGNIMDLYDIYLDSFEKCEQQYGYMGKLTPDGPVADEKISNEIKEKFKKVKAKRTFASLMSRERAYEEKLKHVVDER